ncbi:MAG: WYL domain-containing protein [Flavobacteriales bacterium]|nr:WYL domain-containing protein [Flavobacteriales bacterium]
MPINKSAYRRYKVIDMLVRNKMKPYPTMNEIIEACLEKLSIDSSPNTIQKDIAQMRESPPNGFDAPIYYDHRMKGYAYSDPNYKLNDISLNDSDIDAIKEFIDLIQNIGSSRISEKFNNAMEKILSTVLEEFPEGDTKQHFLQTMTPPKSRGFEHFDLFYKACRTKTPVSFVHYSYKKRKFSAVIIHPFLIKEFENKWYILGYSESHKEIRTFGLDRIFDPFLLRKSFISVNRKIVESAISDYYGVFPIPNQKKQKVKILVSALGTNYFEAYPIHESQKIQKEPNGFSYITFNLVPTLELTRLFLSHGRHVEVKEPEWLIDFTEKLK